MTLYEIDNEILNCVDEETGEIIDEEKLNTLSMDRERKIESIACWFKDLKAEAEAIKTEKKALENRQKIAENKCESLKKYLSTYLNGEKFTSAKAAVSFRKSETVEVTDASLLGEEYLRYRELEANKEAIKAALKAGGTVEGACIVEKKNVIIK